MTNSMPAFAVYKHRAFIGYVHAVSLAQAQQRAKARYGRVEVEMAQNARPARLDHLNAALAENSKRAAPYPTPGFEARRAALIAAHKANA